MSRIKAVFKAAAEDKARFRESSCLLTISVGQEAHEGEKFLATIEMANASFKSCFIFVDDTLQRYTLALEHTQDPAFFYNRALLEGEQWLERNRKSIEKLENLGGVVHWDTWLIHPQYSAQKEKVLEKMAEDAIYRDAFEFTAQQFLNRFEKRNLPFYYDRARAKRLCIDYLVEECAAMCLWPELGCHFEVYPSERNMAMALTYQYFLAGHGLDLLHPVTIKFKSKRNVFLHVKHSLMDNNLGVLVPQEAYA